MTWEIFLGIVALTGFVISIGRIVSMSTKAMQRLEVQNHETRITLLESK